MKPPRLPQEKFKRSYHKKQLELLSLRFNLKRKGCESFKID